MKLDSKAKRCSYCGKFKKKTEFYQGKYKTSSYCKPCTTKYGQERYKRDKDRINARNRLYRLNNKHVEIEWRKNNPEKLKQYWLKTTYGLSQEDYDLLIKECSLCGSKERLVIDHNHDTGEVRGILCFKHNMAIGFLNDNAELVQKAADYLLGKITTRIVK